MKLDNAEDPPFCKMNILQVMGIRGYISSCSYIHLIKKYCELQDWWKILKSEENCKVDAICKNVFNGHLSRVNGQDNFFFTHNQKLQTPQQPSLSAGTRFQLRSLSGQTTVYLLEHWRQWRLPQAFIYTKLIQIVYNYFFP